MTEHNDPSPPASSHKALLVTVWLVVALPALWGVSKTVQTSLKLFHPTAATTTTQPATAPASAIGPTTMAR